MVLVEKQSIVGVSAPVIISPQILGAYAGGYGPTDVISDNKITEYVVQSGDTISSIASFFNISLDTIRWANNLKKDVIQPGQKLTILPVSGVLHVIKKNETLGEITNNYKAKTEEIIDFNNLSNSNDIYIGDIIIIPNGKKPTTPTIARNLVSSGSFVCPTASCRITQRLHWYNAIDFGAPCGSAIYAVADGTVQKVAYGWNGGAGNFLTILHSNGVVTMYGHIQSSLVSPGQKVSQGQTIALIGGQPGTPGAGISTGCHTHFDVRGGVNPFAR
jgi:murein DD-endopeptidase MepM/ murein hydrolase activator NlpD